MAGSATSQIAHYRACKGGTILLTTERRVSSIIRLLMPLVVMLVLTAIACTGPTGLQRQG